MNIDKKYIFQNKIATKIYSKNQNIASRYDFIYDESKFLLHKTVLVIFITILLALPLLFISPDFSIELVNPPNSDQIYKITVHNIIPTKIISATIDKHVIPVSEISDNIYYIEPDRNGTLEITVTLINNQYNSKTIEISGIDKYSPELLDQERTDDELILYLNDVGLGIDYENITAVTLSGKTIRTKAYSKENGKVVFDYPKESVNIYIPDLKGNILHLVLTT